MSRINTMRMPTWAYLGLNYADYEKIDLEKKPYYKESSGSPIKELDEAFEKETYGLSEDIQKENKDLRNFYLSFDIKDKRDLELINLNLDDENDRLISAIDINASEGSDSSFLVNFSNKADRAFINSEIRVNLKRNSRVKLVVVVNLENEATNLNSIASVLEEGATFDISYIEIGAEKSLVNIKNNLRGEKAKVIEDGVYFKSGDEYLDLMAVNEHFANDTDSESLFNGALRDRAHKNFKGIVDLRRGCTKADGKIGDYSMMLSDKVINKSAPVLLNEEREVSGEHAASVGRLNKDMLFYIMSRGFSKKQAESMMLEANFAKAVDKIENEDLRTSIKKTVHELNSQAN